MGRFQTTNSCRIFWTLKFATLFSENEGVVKGRLGLFRKFISFGLDLTKFLETKTFPGTNCLKLKPTPLNVGKSNETKLSQDGLEPTGP